MPSNQDRAEGVGDLIGAYRMRAGMRSSPTTDVLLRMGIDLRHWACANDIPFSRTVNGAAELFWAEVRGEAVGGDALLGAQLPGVLATASQTTPAEMRRAHLTSTEWSVANDIVYGDAEEPREYPEPPEDMHAPLEVPPPGIIDLRYRADRIDDTVTLYAMRNGITQEDRYTQLADLLDDLTHFATRLDVHLERTVIQPSAALFAGECFGPSMDTRQRVYRHLPGIGSQLDRYGTVTVGTDAPDLTFTQWTAVNDLAYWDITPEIDEPEYRAGDSLSQTLFGD